MAEQGKRSAELSVDIRATPAAVWKCLTDAEELTNWFPIEAAVKPGVGGSIVSSWGEGSKWESPITIWEPNRRLRTLWCPAGTPEPDLFGVDYYVEDRGGGVTRVRLVHFGFSKDASMDGFYDGVKRGWDFMLAGMKVYLERHAGTPRSVLYLHAKTGGRTSESVWSEAFAADGALPSGRLMGLAPGEPFAVTVGGVELRGRVRVNDRNRMFQGVIENMGDALLNMQIDKCHGGPGHELYVKLTSFGVPKATLERLHAAWREAVSRICGGAALKEAKAIR